MKLIKKILVTIHDYLRVPDRIHFLLIFNLIEFFIARVIKYFKNHLNSSNNDIFFIFNSNIRQGPSVKT